MEEKNEDLHSNIPKAEELIPDQVQKTSNLKNFFFGWVEDKYDKFFIFILIVAFGIRFWIFLNTADQALWYDAANYLAAAKKWGLSLEMRDVWYYRRGFFWPVYSAIFYMTGIGEAGIRFSIALFSTGIVASSYFLIKEMFNKRLALAVSIFLTFSWILLFFSARPLTSIPATFFVITSLVFFWKGYVKNQGNKYMYIFAVFFSLAALTRMQYLLFVPVFLIYMFTKEKFKMFKNKVLWISVLIFFIIFIPHWILYYQHYGNPVTDIMAHYFLIGTEGNVAKAPRDYSRLHVYFLDLPYVIKGTPRPGFYSITSTILYFLFLIGIPYFFLDLVLGFDKIFKNKRIQKKLFIFLWIVILFLVLGFVTKDYSEQRYIMPALPFIYLIAVYPIIKFGTYLRKNMKLDRKYANIIIFTILLIFLIPNYLFGVNLIESKKTSYSELKTAGEWIKENSNPSDIIITPSEPQIAYYAERSTYTEGRDIEELEKKISELRPRFLLLYAPEGPQWLFQYPADNKEFLIPVHALQVNNQPILVIYEFDYSNYPN